MLLRTTRAFLGYFLLSCILLLPQAEAYSDSHVSEPPPAVLGDLFYIVRYEDGKAELFKNLSEHKEKKLRKKHKVKDVLKTSYAEIAALVTNRVYDYQYYFEQYINTDQTTNPQQWKVALDQLMDVFSKNLTLYTDIGNETLTATSWGQVREVFIGYLTFFKGWTLQIAPNVRVIPLCNNRDAQAYISSCQLGWSRVNIGYEGVYPFASNIGFYDFTFSYEKDNVWRIKTANSDNRIAYLFAPPFVYGPTPYVPYAEDPKSGCCKYSSSSSSSSD